MTDRQLNPAAVAQVRRLMADYLTQGEPMPGDALLLETLQTLQTLGSANYRNPYRKEP